MFTSTLSRRSHMDKMKSALKCLKKDGVSFCLQAGSNASLPSHCPAGEVHSGTERHPKYLPGRTSHTDPFREWFILLEGFWRNQRLRDDPHRADVFLHRLSSLNGSEISDLRVFQMFGLHLAQQGDGWPLAPREAVGCESLSTWSHLSPPKPNMSEKVLSQA